MNMNKMITFAAVAASVMMSSSASAAALSPRQADAYQFIVSGYPAANVSYSAASSGTSLEAATRSGGSAASALEARYRTWDESDGIALRSDEYRGMMIYIR